MKIIIYDTGQKYYLEVPDDPDWSNLAQYVEKKEDRVEKDNKEV